MSASLKWRLALGFVLVFVAGVAAGAFFGAAHFMQPPRPDFTHHRSLTDRMRNQMKTRLDLTPEQIERTAPLIEKTAQELEAIRAETGRRVRETLAASDRELAPLLTPEQRTKLEALAARRDAGRDNRRPHLDGPHDPKP